MSMTLEMVAERVAVLENQMTLLLSEKAVDVSHTKDAKAPKKTKKDKEDDDKPKKKRTSGYILYSNTHLGEVKESLTEADDSE